MTTTMQKQDAVELADLPIHRLAPLIKAGVVSPVALVEACLARIKQSDDHLRAFIDVWADEARSDAQQAEAAIAAGRYLGPLHGIPIALKDLIEVEGRRTTVGSAYWRERISPCTAAVVKRLEATGAILLGKLHMVEFAFGSWAPTRS